MTISRLLDQFYTHPEVARQCLDAAAPWLSAYPDAILLEPSAGEGAFFSLLPAARRLGLDLAPRHPGVQQKDFFTFQPAPHARYVVLGNPPFGKNASLAVRFFNHAAQFADLIAFIVPLTFRKDSLVNRLDSGFTLVMDQALPAFSFLFEGRSYDVPCCFQVWERRVCPRLPRVSALTHPDFSFVKAEAADFAVRRVGALAGKVLPEFSGYAVSSHYFVKSHIGSALLQSRLGAIDWSDVRGNTAGNPSLAKRELVAEYQRRHGAGS